MATFTSSWKSYGSGAQARLILEIDDPGTIGSGTSSIDPQARLKVQTSHSLVDSVNTNTLTGDLGSNTISNISVSHGSGGGTTQVCSVRGTVSTVYGSSVRVDVTGSISGYEALSDDSVSGHIIVPARPISAPLAPTGASVSRNSDTSQTVTWTRTSPSSSSRPYQSQRVERRYYLGGWSGWANRSGTLSSSATSYTDTTVTNLHYEYRVRALNSAGSAVSGTDDVWTTPSDPSGASAVRSGSDIVVSWTNTARYGEFNTEIYHSEDGGAYSLALTRGAGATDWTDTAPDPAKTHRYRVRHKTTAMSPTLYSGYSTTSTVQLAAAPNAPTGLSGPSIRDATEDVTWTWTHNPVDSSPQEDYQVRHRVVGAGSWTTGSKTASGTSSYTLPGGTYSNPDTIEWEVRTWGQHADPSPYSATATSPTSTRPTVLINAPADASTVTESQVTVEWGYSDAEASPQSTWTVELLDATSTVVESRSGSGTATSVDLDTVLGDGTTWTVRARVQESAGLRSAWDSVGFSVEYALPPTPTVAATWDGSEASMIVSVTVPDPVGAEIAADHVDIYRSIDDGAWVLIATGVPVNTAMTDYSPTAAGSTRYYADAVSSLPSVASSAVVEVITPQAGDEAALWLSGGPGYSQVCRLSSNVQITPSADRRVRVLHQFAGREHPVETVSEAVTNQWAVSGDVISTSLSPSTEPAEWLALAALGGPFLLRAPLNGGLYVHVSVAGLSAPRQAGGIVTGIRFTATRIDPN